MPDRKTLPQLVEGPFLTDGGLETTLVFLENIDLPNFSAFCVLSDENAAEKLREYYRSYLEIAASAGLGFVLDTPTWRANPDWGEKLGLSNQELDQVNRDAVGFIAALKAEYADRIRNMILNGVVGPRGDGYVPGDAMSEQAARKYHSDQIQSFAQASVDMVSAITMTNIPEAAGIALAAKQEGLPCAISFTVETDGRLPTGQTLAEAIKAVDGTTCEYPAYYMINCAHPTHFDHVLNPQENWAKRIRGVRANASTLSHEELDAAETLDDGNPIVFGLENASLREKTSQVGSFWRVLRHRPPSRAGNLPSFDPVDFTPREVRKPMKRKRDNIHQIPSGAVVFLDKTPVKRPSSVEAPIILPIGDQTSYKSILLKRRRRRMRLWGRR